MNVLFLILKNDIFDCSFTNILILYHFLTSLFMSWYLKFGFEIFCQKLLWKYCMLALFSKIYLHKEYWNYLRIIQLNKPFKNIIRNYALFNNLFVLFNVYINQYFRNFLYIFLLYISTNLVKIFSRFLLCMYSIILEFFFFLFLIIFYLHIIGFISIFLLCWRP